MVLLKTNLIRSRYFIYLYLAPLKVLVFLFIGILMSLDKRGFVDHFTNFSVGWGNHTVNTFSVSKYRLWHLYRPKYLNSRIRIPGRFRANATWSRADVQFGNRFDYSRPTQYHLHPPNTDALWIRRVPCRPRSLQNQNTEHQFLSAFKPHSSGLHSRCNVDGRPTTRQCLYIPWIPTRLSIL